MGATICNTYIESGSQIGEFEPIMATFNPTTAQIQIKPEHDQLFNKIKYKYDVIDCRKKNELKWYESLKYNLYLFGNVSRDRPIGQCFFYIRDPKITTTPIIISTHVNDHYIYSRKTLILYPDNIFYYGSIKNNIATLPRAQGNGILVSTDFIYKGQFKNGYPHGYGTYRSKNMQYVGSFVNGEPFGQCIQKFSNKLFIGTIQENGIRKGFVIDKNNEKKDIDTKDKLNQSRLSIKSHIRE